ncbi:Kinesin light chain 4 [Trichoplax sp. H2]|nr:Kinesin light chain 4 [Trichoplax sp. H2]|eukprot:RDD44094.1 Kinesin light chain 4 [Trichoplax sp. H2]
MLVIYTPMLNRATQILVHMLRIIVLDIRDIQGKHEEIISMHEKSLEIRLLVLVHDYLDIAVAYCNLGNAYFYQVMQKDAISRFYNNKEAAYRHQSERKEAISMYEKSLKIQLSILGPNNPDVAQSCNNLRTTCNDENYTTLPREEAISMRKESLKIQLSVLDHNHPDLTK